MDLYTIQQLVQAGLYEYTLHANIERKVEKTFHAIYQQKHQPDDEVLMPVTVFA